jgi:hypothetical protein
MIALLRKNPVCIGTGEGVMKLPNGREYIADFRQCGIRILVIIYKRFDEALKFSDLFVRLSFDWHTHVGKIILFAVRHIHLSTDSNRWLI